MTEINVSGKVAIVTGGSRGIGDEYVQTNALAPKVIQTQYSVPVQQNKTRASANGFWHGQGGWGNLMMWRTQHCFWHRRSVIISNGVVLTVEGGPWYQRDCSFTIYNTVPPPPLIPAQFLFVVGRVARLRLLVPMRESRASFPTGHEWQR